ncbi:hypothetical protein AMECASPLE_013282 [Ameca splendens]|uniref:Uncharacterized protein n=1 Tax=Ameca splendens TaxID=208324 RepID=A0ABV1A7L9_9TELE
MQRTTRDRKVQRVDLLNTSPEDGDRDWKPLAAGEDQSYYWTSENKPEQNVWLTGESGVDHQGDSPQNLGCVCVVVSTAVAGEAVPSEGTGRVLGRRTGFAQLEDSPGSQQKRFDPGLGSDRVSVSQVCSVWFRGKHHLEVSGQGRLVQE